MLANAIAEMRTYGEGFIIVDQSPGLMDMSVIRNTNTKIILRLPDATDRELVGKAANLNDDQIIELAKLKTGVCAVYQNNWIEPVLCHVDEWDNKKNKKGSNEHEELIDNQEVKREIIKMVLLPVGRIDVEKCELSEKDLLKTRLASGLKIKIKKLLNEKSVEKYRNLRKNIIYEIFEPDTILEKNICYRNEIKEWCNAMQEELIPRLELFDADEREKILAILADEKSRIEGKNEYTELMKNLMIFLDAERRHM